MEDSTKMAIATLLLGIFIIYMFHRMFRTPKQDKPKVIRSDYELEHYPLTDKWFAKYQGRYLTCHYKTHIVSTTDLLGIADSFRFEDEAMKLVNLHKEQVGKVNITIKPVN